MNNYTASSEVQRNVEIDGERFALVVATTFEDATAWTAVHRQNFDRHIGGIRMTIGGGIEEVGHLSSAMTAKCGAALVPFDGEKSLISRPSGRLETTEEKVKLVGVHLRALIEAAPGATLGPDMYLGEDVMTGLGQMPEFQDHITGKSTLAGGLGIDSNGATAAGLFQAISRFREQDSQLNTATIQGFGAVGADLARRLADVDVKIVGVSNFLGTLEAQGTEGLDVADLIRLRSDDGSERFDDLELQRYANSHPDCIYHEGDRDRILSIPTDMFIPAARTMVLAETHELERRKTENPEVKDVRQFLEDTKVRLVVEGANHPLSLLAEDYLESKGVRVLTDFLVNMGGVVGCIFEWAYLPELMGSDTALPKVNQQATEWTQAVGARNVHGILESNETTRKAGLSLAKRSIQLMQDHLRGLKNGGMARERIQAYLESGIPKDW